MTAQQKLPKLRIGLVVPHIFMHRELLPKVIFSPGELALSLANELMSLGCEVTLYSPGPVQTQAANITADLSLFEQELQGRGDTYLSLLKKHPFTFITLARQVQSELIARAYQDANAGKLDIVHVYTNEEEIALPFTVLCKKPVVFTHHDPFNFLVKYKNCFPKYKHLNWISMSLAQRSSMPSDTNWVANIYHGLNGTKLTPVENPSRDYFAYLGRIIEPKGVHLAIQAVRAYNAGAKQPLPLRIAGKHYSAHEKKSYWDRRIAPELDEMIVYDGFIQKPEHKRWFLGNAAALIVPSVFDEPFGMVSLEAFACGTPVIALDSGALPEVITHGKTGFIAKKIYDNRVLNETKTANNLHRQLQKWAELDRATCRRTYTQHFTARHMAAQHAALYRKLAQASVMRTDHAPD